MAYPRFQLSRSFKVGTIANASRNSATFVDLDTAQDKILPAELGDILVCWGRIYLGNEAVSVYLDIGSYVAAGPTFTHWGDTNDGSFFWLPTTAAWFGPAFYAQRKVAAADLDSSNNVTVRWRYKTSAAKTVGVPRFHVQNLGPVDPN